MSTDPDAQAPGGGETGDHRLATTPEELRAIFVNSNLCRVIYADGAWGSVTSQANIHMALYSEHLRLPDSVTYRLDEEERVHETREFQRDLVREIEVEVILNTRTARALRDWLNGKIEQAERAARTLTSLEEAGQ